MSWDIRLNYQYLVMVQLVYNIKKIYIFGGISRKGIHKRAWNYDLETKIWYEMKICQI